MKKAKLQLNIEFSNSLCLDRKLLEQRLRQYFGLLDSDKIIINIYYDDNNVFVDSTFILQEVDPLTVITKLEEFVTGIKINKRHIYYGV